MMNLHGVFDGDDDDDIDDGEGDDYDDDDDEVDRAFGWSGQSFLWCIERIPRGQLFQRWPLQCGSSCTCRGTYSRTTA